MNEDNKSLVVAEYALGLLDKAEEKTVEQRLRSDSKIREMFIGWSEYLAALYDGKEEIFPSKSLKHSINRRLFGE